MTDTPPSNPPAANSDSQNSPAGNKPGPFKVYETQEQYQASLNRKLANYVPKAEYQAALDRAAALETSLGTIQSENQGLKTTISGYEIGNLKSKIAREFGLNAVTNRDGTIEDWTEDLHGSDEASLKAHAESLRKKLGVKNKFGLPVPPGANATPANSFNQELLRAFGRGGR